ncbi:hypothetical protein I314_05056 [Cryptococcus bacillisporus CA1873]|uniref:Pet127-domain-containing protein n=1 Tax=Cryptococcus bacillisporus CA1873 TaxID=1296111 RepID=A0ABR5B661_CRYGA|nr:hypothetical protein I314_05056 [Cryptococcus bacillisporus CA1873]|eukprot:KIR59072.1 hypothetical protein I314_05056 [Cryptococcus gattii CA1873]
MLPRAHLSPSLLRCTGATATHVLPRPATRGLVDTAPATSLAELARQASKYLTSRSDASASLEQSAQPTTSNDEAAKTAQSLGQQGRADLAVDLSSLSSGLDYRRRLRTKAPHLKINSSSKNSLDVSESKVGQNAHRRRRLSLRTFAGHVRNQKLDTGSDQSVNSVDHGDEKSDFELPTGSDASGGKRTDAFSEGTSKSEIESEEGEAIESGSLSASKIPIGKVKPAREMRVAQLRKGLNRVLFSPGIHHLRDPRTGVWNFDASLSDIPQPQDFAFHRCPLYITPSQDKELLELAHKYACRFLGSTSTVSKSLSQIYFALSGGRGIDTSILSQDFSTGRSDFTRGAELPASIVLNRLGKRTYSIDNDKTYDVDNILSDFGHILEKMLTSEAEDLKRFLLSSPEESVSEAERTEREAYHYKKIGSMLLRSQLDCYHPDLPGSGVFDIKTRACFPIRYDSANYLANSVYDIFKDRGYTGSYEREYYDLMRAVMLKYSFQVRIGGMDGIFLAYHNTSRIFGFQYVPLTEIDQRIFGSSEMADAAFKISVTILQKLLDLGVKAFSGVDVKMIIKHTPNIDQNSVTAYVEPKHWKAEKGPPPVQAITITMENFLDGQLIQGQIPAFVVDERTRQVPEWTVKYSVVKTGMDEIGQLEARKGAQSLRKKLVDMASLYIPEGHTVESVTRYYEARRQAIEAGRHAATASLTDLPEPTDIVDDDVKDGENATQDEESLIPASVEEKAVKSAEQLLTIQWKKPAKHTLKLRREAKASGKAYEERKKTWGSAQKQP